MADSQWVQRSYNTSARGHFRPRMTRPSQFARLLLPQSTLQDRTDEKRGLTRKFSVLDPLQHNGRGRRSWVMSWSTLRPVVTIQLGRWNVGTLEIEFRYGRRAMYVTTIRHI